MLQRLAHILAVLIGMSWLIICVIVLAQSSPQPARESPDANRSQADRKGDNSKNLPPPPLTAAQPEPANHRDQASDWNKQLRERVFDPITWFTGLLVWVGWRQWRAMHRQAEYLREGMTATKEAADAARDSARTAEQSLKILNRPWLDTDNWRCDEPLRVDNQVIGFRVWFDIVNPGNTPARIRHIDLNHFTTEGHTTGTVNPQPLNHVITPHGRFSYPYDLRLSNDDRARYNDFVNGLVICFRGVIYFDDPFERIETTGAYRFGARRRRFGRNAIFKPTERQPRFLIPPGAEAVGLSDEDWEHEIGQHQPKDEKD